MWKGHPQNDLYFVGWEVKPSQSLTHLLTLEVGNAELTLVLVVY